MLNQGDILNKRYTVKKPLGGGAYGTVYLVEDQAQGGQERALKEVAESELPPGERDEARILFEREGAILKSLRHPGLPGVTDVFSRGDCHYLVMEYIQGHTLEELLKQKGGPFTAAEVIPWAYQLSAVLEYLHTRPEPVIFRDLKPSNIMIDRNGRIRLIDFGIARYFKPGKAKDTFFMGTPGFSPPEQYGRGQSDHRSDLFSFGATFFYLLTDVDTAQFATSFPPLGTLAHDIPGWLEKVITRCLAINPGERYQSTASLVKDMEKQRFSADDAPIDAPLPPPSAGGATLTSSLKVVAVAAVGLLVAYWLYCIFPPILLLYMVVGFYYASRALSCNSVISLFIVLGIFAMLAAIFVPSFLGAREQGQLTGCKSNLKNIGTAMEMYYTDNPLPLWQRKNPNTTNPVEGLYPRSLDKITPSYLKTLPTCPKAGRCTYTYLTSDDLGNFTVYCRGAKHKIYRGPVDNYPQYDSYQGLIER